MVERHWKGIAKAEYADAYVSHLVSETFPKLKKLDGFIGASILKRPVDEGVEFLIVTAWKSLEAVRQFAGENADKAVVPDTVQKMMISFESHVLHYESVLSLKPAD